MVKERYTGRDRTSVAREGPYGRNRKETDGTEDTVTVSAVHILVTHILGLSAPYLVSLPHLLRIPFGSPPE